jgi:2-polyprenyl-3-methyl-5-hydroxy-6-metoxy-1,4-benzoquinol methylase
MTSRDGVSAFGCVHAANPLPANAGSLLVIGGAGGSFATMMARRGYRVTVVDIDPVAEELARAAGLPT